MSRAVPLPIQAPIPPDRAICYRHQGARPILPSDCQRAIDQNWPDGNNFVQYYLQDPRPSNAQWIPSVEYSGSCRVALEPAGPREHYPHTLLLRPNSLRGLAGHLIQTCAAESHGIGGFITLGLIGAMGYIHNPVNESWNGNFLTISIHPRIHRDRQMSNLEPGSHNPNIAALLSQHAASLARAMGSTGRKVGLSDVQGPVRIILDKFFGRCIDLFCNRLRSRRVPRKL